MSNQRALQPTNSQEKLRQLENEFAQAKELLREAEADLAREQAEINAFRMHCRLKLGPWVEEIQELKVTKQRLLTRLTMWQQAAESGQPFDPDEWLEDDFDPEPEPIDDQEDGIRPIVDPLPSDRKAEKRLYRELARRFHPDLIEDALMRSYATSMMAAVNEAYAQKDIQALRDLAGELDPQTVKEITADPGVGSKVKTLQKRLRKCRQRIRKIRYQLKTLRQELVSSLWRKAQQVDPNDGENWWDEVADLFTADIKHLKGEITALHDRLQKIEIA